jgi:Transglutaminase-like superfamily
METWRSFWRLPGFERTIALEAGLAHLITLVGLRLAGFRRWKNLLDRLSHANSSDGTPNPPSGANPVREIARLQAATARHLPFRTNCLEQSLVLCWLLERHGIPADLRIGARKEADRFEAHAWVEVAGCPVDAGSEEHIHFVPFKASVDSLETQVP